MPLAPQPDAGAARAGGPIHDEFGQFQDAQVLGDRGAADGQTARDLAYGQGAGKQALEDGTAGSIAEGVELGHLVSTH